MLKCATTDHALGHRWRVVAEDEAINGGTPEDMSIYTDDGFEVVGCSEWMRADRAVFDHIVALHNASLQEQKP